MNVYYVEFKRHYTGNATITQKVGVFVDADTEAQAECLAYIQMPIMYPAWFTDNSKKAFSPIELHNILKLRSA